jgi:hypothetical protein
MQFYLGIVYPKIISLLIINSSVRFFIEVSDNAVLVIFLTFGTMRNSRSAYQARSKNCLSSRVRFVLEMINDSS